MKKKTISGLDIETTGLDVHDGHRIIELALLDYDFDTGQLVDKLVMRIDPQRPIDPEAEAVHKIAYSDLVGCPRWEDVAEEISNRLNRTGLLIIHNAGFDEPFIRAELARVKAPIVLTSSFCTMENGRWACFDGKVPRLEELCFALGVDYDPAQAHAAEYDVDKMMSCYFRGMQRGFFPNPKSFESLYAL